jgi:2-polyprenyl-3-methyl-5-hydroxy-6-metoxy-1,4-benzoquinol methylase
MTHAVAGAAPQAAGEPEAAEIRWRAEACYFDRVARAVDEGRLPVDPLVLDRYRRPRLRRRFNKEFRFRTLGPLAGKKVLDVGCGDGLNAVLMARLGASVTGLDVSGEVVELARRRAAANGVAGSTTFVCGPVETAEFPRGSFDVIWGEEILHHVVDDLERVLRRLTAWAKPSGLLLFAEPIALSGALRRLRSALAARPRPIAGERPLAAGDLDLLRRSLPDLRLRPYCLFARLVPFLLGGVSYERSSRARRAIVNTIDSVDYLLLSLPLVRRLGGVGVLYGHPLPARAPDAAGG